MDGAFLLKRHSGRRDTTKMMLEAKLFVQVSNRSLTPSASGGASHLLRNDEGSFFRFNVDYRDSYGRTPLREAGERNQISAVEALLDHGASTRIQDIQGNTALHVAAASGGAIIIDRLLRDRYALDIANGAGEYPEHVARRLQRGDIVKGLAPLPRYPFRLLKTLFVNG